MPAPVLQAEPPAPTPVEFTEPPPPPQKQTPRSEDVEEPMEQEETDHAALEVTSEAVSQVKHLNHQHHSWHPCRPVQEQIALADR